MNEAAMKARLKAIDDAFTILKREGSRLASVAGSAKSLESGAARASETIDRLLAGSSQSVDSDMRGSLAQAATSARRFNDSMTGIFAGMAEIRKTLAREAADLRAQLAEIQRRREAAAAAARRARR